MYTKEQTSPPLLTDKIKPFTENDFDRHFNKIFPVEFVKSILKVKTDTLLKNGNYETIELSDGRMTTFQMLASFDKADNTLELNLATKTIFKENEADTTEADEFNIIYQFKIADNKQIKFKQVRLAG
ncbi:MAG: hypothetical protein SFU87_20960 [Chitinophagaceae bacterium]|nr:hypothetical protein [Chitinophagaceae bacterium]